MEELLLGSIRKGIKMKNRTVVKVDKDNQSFGGNHVQVTLADEQVEVWPNDMNLYVRKTDKANISILKQ